MNSIVIFFRFLFRHKWKIVLTFSLTVFFLIFLFPLSDLNDYISTQVSKLTRNNVFLQFDQMHLSPLTTSISLEKVYVETPQISSLTSEELSFSPSIAALIARKPGGTVIAKGFLKGELEIGVHPAKSTTPGVDKSKIDIVATNINLKDARQATNLSLPIEGKLSLTSTAVADLTMTEQPDVDLSLTVLSFRMASTGLSLRDLGQINLPEIKLGKIEVKGRLANGKFQIENGKLGTPQDEFYGDVKGDMALTFQNVQGQIVPVIGAYNISLDLKATAAFKEKAKFFLTFLDGYKIENGSSTNYKFKIQASAMGMPPQFTPIR